MKTVVFFCAFCVLQLTVVQAAPPIEPCPPDSSLSEDICKCDPSLCSKPLCPFTLAVVSNGTDIPGSCCNVYSCEGCPNSTLVQGKCPCAPGAILNERGKCECVDPHMRLQGGKECVCDESLCELPQLCDANHVAVAQVEGCCRKTKCIKCPAGSYAINNGDDAVEDKCVCYPCKKKECGPDERVVVKEHGTGFPGKCCDMYTCESALGQDQCNEHGEGEKWETENETCQCQNGIAFCDKKEESFQRCHKDGGFYNNGEWWMPDSCTNCSCVNGEAKCIAHYCDIQVGHIPEPECQPLNCSKVCPDGYRLNKRGCKTCKCNYSSKYDDILLKYNLTKAQLRDIVDGYFGRGLEVTTSGDEQRNLNTTSGGLDEDRSSAQDIKWLAIGIVIGMAACLAVMIVITLCRSQRKKGSYDTTSGGTSDERVNLTKDNNNYIDSGTKYKSKISA